jgi:AcrR family transcriptional regulator
MKQDGHPRSADTAAELCGPPRRVRRLRLRRHVGTGHHGGGGGEPGAITYHFGSKQALYEAVLSRCRGRGGAAGGGGGWGASGRATDRAGDVVRVLFGYWAQHAEVPRLMLQALASREGPPAAVAQHLQRLLGALAAWCRRASATARSGPAILGCWRYR